MRSRIIVLLAVCSEIAAAGPLRHNGARVQHHNVARFLNQTNTPSIPAEIQTSTPTPISSTSVITSIAAIPETLAFAVTSSTTPAARPLTPDVGSSSSPAADTLTVSTPSPVLSTSATLLSTLPTTAAPDHSDAAISITPISTSSLVFGGSLSGDNSDAANVQPAETLSRLFNIGGSPPDDLQLSTNAPSSSSTPSPSLGVNTQTISDLQSTSDAGKVVTMPSLSFIEDQATSSFTEASIPSSSSATDSKFSSSSTKLVHTSSSAAAGQAPSQVIVPIPVSSGVVQVLGAGGDTVDEFAPVTLDSSLPAPTGTAKYPTAEGGNIAMALGFNDVYKTLNEDTACNSGDPNQAYACVDGEIAECQSDQTYVLKSCPRFQSCYALPKPSDLAGVVVQCAIPSDASSMLAGPSPSTAGMVAITSQPAQMLQAEGDFSQATQSVSAQNPVRPMTSSSSVQTTIQSQAMSPAPSGHVINTGSDQVVKSAILTGTSPTSVQTAFQSQLQVLNPSVLAAPATAQQVHDPSPLSNSQTSDTSPPATSNTAAVFSVPKALFAVVTAVANDQAPPNENSAQASIPTPQTSRPSPEISPTRTPQSSVMSPQANPDSLQLVEAGVSSTSTSSAEGAAITFAPMGAPVNEKVAVGNSPATVTVTVTVTTTEKTAPVTMIAS